MTSNDVRLTDNTILMVSAIFFRSSSSAIVHPASVKRQQNPPIPTPSPARHLHTVFGIGGWRYDIPILSISWWTLEN